MLTRRGFLSASAAALVAAEPPHPKLFILLVAEQFRSDYLDRWAHLMGTGGFRRLMAEGAYFPDCRHKASTFTSTGLATIATGAWPDAHGVVADAWYDTGARQLAAASGASLLATTLADAVNAADPRTPSTPPIRATR
ncbi:MAG: alkaline phosphatase family protein [Candidatus Solibacter usitatus]|nr:alkaline phosphatase family protein [Candidatus Solibacter usitatus]